MTGLTKRSLVSLEMLNVKRRGKCAARLFNFNLFVLKDSLKFQLQNGYHGTSDSVLYELKKFRGLLKIYNCL